MKKQLTKVCLLLLLFISNISCKDYPILTVVIVVDQLANHQFKKLIPNLNGGIKFLYENGTHYSDARFPYAATTTAAGHASLGTGTTPKDHGIMANYWFDENDNKIKSVNDLTKTSPVFYCENDKKIKYKSASNIKVDGLSDQVMLQDKENNKVFSISIKDRAAIGMANKLGKAIWFDSAAHKFSSSKAYFNMIPKWVDDFNNKNLPTKDFKWELAYPKKSSYYDMVNINSYNYAAEKSLIDSIILFSDKNLKTKNQHENFLRSPKSSAMLLELAKECIKNEFVDKPKTKFLLWISLSNLDKVGHLFGPDSYEYNDAVYQIDKQLDHFIKFVYSKVDPKKVLFVFTADHGVLRIPEILQEQHFNAKRISPKDIIANLNAEIEKQFKIKNLVKTYKTPQFHLEKSILNKMDPAEKTKILDKIKSILKENPAFKNCWTFEELSKTSYPKDSIEFTYKNQLYPGRSGQIICQTQPYMYIADYKTGTGHGTPYGYDSQVPLILYRNNNIKHKKVVKKVYTPQIANTVAYIMDVPKPSASFYEVLPYLNND